LPGYFGALRWSYYRLRTEGHNTLTVDDRNEDLDAVAPLIQFASDTNGSVAVADLKAAYPQTLADWQRGIRLLSGRRVLVQDEVVPRKAADITWNFHTRATITILPAGGEALLTQGNVKWLARILSPGDGKFEQIPVQASWPQRSTAGVRNLLIRRPHTAAPMTLAVLFSPPEDSLPRPEIRPLNRWEP